MAASNPDIINAVGSFSPGPPAALGQLKASKGITTVARTAGEPAGAWRLTLEGGFADSQDCLLATANTLGLNAGAQATGVAGDPTQIEVRTTLAGVLTDLPFTVVVFRPGIGSSPRNI